MKIKKVLTLAMAVAMVAGTSLSAFAADTDESVSDNKIIFEAGGGTVTPPVDPEEPDEPGDPDEKEKPTGNTGSLRLDVVPVFDFGTQNITTGDKSYFAELPEDQTLNEEIPYYVQVTDLRGSGDGWSLSAKMTQQFSDGTNTLSGAEINLSNVGAEAQTGTTAPSTTIDGTLKYDAVNDTSIKIASAATNEGMGVSAVRFGDTARYGSTLNADESVELTIPAATQVYQTTYQATIQWTLGATP